MRWKMECPKCRRAVFDVDLSDRHLVNSPAPYTCSFRGYTGRLVDFIVGDGIGRCTYIGRNMYNNRMIWR